LQKGKELYEAGERRASVILGKIKEKLESTEGVVLQYVEIRDAETLERIETIEGPVVIALAAWVGRTRLIDNIILGR